MLPQENRELYQYHFSVPKVLCQNKKPLQDLDRLIEACMSHTF